ncbi:hypothetical protein [Phocaeicola coprocola]|uniref:hypothetical protein n=1 Tax=Phocaeicola coprocola TaxID=310298 RepID=UPI0022E857FB|nr:hypothetical protein [Phocaeicola coprocola]
MKPKTKSPHETEYRYSIRPFKSVETVLAFRKKRPSAGVFSLCNRTALLCPASVGSGRHLSPSRRYVGYGHRLYLRPGRVRAARLVRPHRHSGLFGITAPAAEGKQQQDEPLSGR